MSSPFEKIDALKAEWDALQPLSPENGHRLWQKLRLEWNYHSNHIEGNTLTYGETVLLLLHGQTHGNHLLREYEEMKAHDVGVAHLRSLALDRDRLIGPSDIRDLNRIILKEPFWKPTRTSDGQPTRSQVVPGEYKTLPNSVITATGEFFEYAAPIDVPIRMQALIDWLAAALEEGSAHLVQIAAKLHHDFVLIHPFDDGNGRVARMLVNYLLLREGYPPLVVPTEKKSGYLAALRLADAGELIPLANFLAGEVERSLKLAIRAATGENIEEPSDVEKQVAIFARELLSQPTEQGLPSEERLQELASTTFLPFVAMLQSKMEKLKLLFGSLGIVTDGAKGGQIIGEYVVVDELWTPVPGSSFSMGFIFSKSVRPALVASEYRTNVAIRFGPEHYTITQDEEVILSPSYSRSLSAEEIDHLTASILTRSFEAIKVGAAKTD